MKVLFFFESIVYVASLSFLINGWGGIKPGSQLDEITTFSAEFKIFGPSSVPTPIGSVTSQPTCQLPVGTITITSPLGAEYQYSLAAVPYQSSPVFNNLAPGTYLITARSTVTAEVSAPLSLVVNNDPVRPAQPVLAIKQPDCVIHTGTITITSPLGPDLEYSKDGNSYQVSPVFSGLPERTYTMRVRNIEGCISPITVVIILDNSIAPAAPVLTIIQPKCPLLSGTVIVTSPLGPLLEYSSNDGASWQVSNIFTDVPGGNYNFHSRFVGTNCTSLATQARLDVVTPQNCTTTIAPVIYFPSAFTPNGDHLNDGFGAGPPGNLAGVSNYSLAVFNRYGEMVFHTTNPLSRWNGSTKGSVIHGSTYTWAASYHFGNGQLVQQKGTVVVIR